jgi:hypothetical protein
MRALRTWTCNICTESESLPDAAYPCCFQKANDLLQRMHKGELRCGALRNNTL